MPDARADLFYMPSAQNGRLGVLPALDGRAYACIDGVSRHGDWDMDSAVSHMNALAWWLEQEADE